MRGETDPPPSVVDIVDPVDIVDIVDLRGPAGNRHAGGRPTGGVLRRLLVAGAVVALAGLGAAAMFLPGQGDAPSTDRPPGAATPAAGAGRLGPTATVRPTAVPTPTPEQLPAGAGAALLRDLGVTASHLVVRHGATLRFVELAGGGEVLLRHAGLAGSARDNLVSLASHLVVSGSAAVELIEPDGTVTMLAPAPATTVEVSPSATRVLVVTAGEDGASEVQVLAARGTVVNTVTLPAPAGVVAVLDSGRLLVDGGGATGTYEIRGDDLRGATRVSRRTVVAVAGEALLTAGCEQQVVCGTWLEPLVGEGSERLVLAEVYATDAEVAQVGGLAVVEGRDPRVRQGFFPRFFLVDVVAGEARELAVEVPPGGARRFTWDPGGAVVAWPEGDGITFHAAGNGRRVHLAIAGGLPDAIALLP
jgi:hypothetical protein